MRQHHSTLYVQRADLRLSLHESAVEISRPGQPPTRLPLHHLQSIVLFAYASVTPPLMQRCAEEGISIVFLSYTGRFQARVEGPTSGNVLLRRAQYAAADSAAGVEIARMIVVGKIRNCRTLLRRALREQPHLELPTTIQRLKLLQQDCHRAPDLDSLRGLGGMAANLYFSAWPGLLHGDEGMRFSTRSRRPPLDEVNAALSFLYALLRADCHTAAEVVGLDPQVGFLHRDRPGRPSLALDLMEELRPVYADRLLWALVNRRQLRPDHFVRESTGAVLLTEEGRKLLIRAYAERKPQEFEHPYLAFRTDWALLPMLQARILARFLRRDLDSYVPFVLED